MQWSKEVGKFVLEDISYLNGLYNIISWKVFPWKKFVTKIITVKITIYAFVLHNNLFVEFVVNRNTTSIDTENNSPVTENLASPMSAYVGLEGFLPNQNSVDVCRFFADL